MTALKTNERLLYDILNDCWPGKWKQDITFLEGRKYRGDAVNTEDKIVIEIEGGIYPFFMTTKTGQRIKVQRGCHGSISGIERDIEKHNAMAIDGWRSLRYTPETLKKRPYQIIRDIRMMCGASTNPSGQTMLCFDDVKQPGQQMQVKLGV